MLFVVNVKEKPARYQNLVLRAGFQITFIPKGFKVHFYWRLSQLRERGSTCAALKTIELLSCHAWISFVAICGAINIM